MAKKSPRTRRIFPFLRAFLGGSAALGSALSWGCSGGESGLVLGRPLPDLRGGGAGGTDQLAASGMASLAGADASPDAGAAGTPPSQPIDPPWVGEKCTPILHFENRDTTTQGQLFTDAVPDPSEVVWAASHAACRLLYHDGSEVKSVPELSLVVEASAGIAYTAGSMMHLSTPYLKSQADAGVDLRHEITGILHFTTALVYENSGATGDPASPGWLLGGIADYVRLESGYIARSERMKGGAYDSRSSVTAFFLEYLATRNPNIVYALNQRLSPTSAFWSDDVFVQLMGSDLNTLWADYQASF